ncbi:hypothetical protein CB0940_03105 [Cercospora beticola]|uniref:Serine-rich protein n=1 Tax=Cercospora beticola TaxID=122368 RepID=A0A2G5I321_CERBT|nr:hypothetical protein CB0940_03105 [Cercospora beticola]PIA99151.1 hypothetical protein CB0940_03105 [Cercospora beticola]WPB00271.1 hypothetical protein RHO25_004890 [Cercospora beticola]CAK1361531.1 unnamed protein product [Cercospora beticola]
MSSGGRVRERKELYERLAKRKSRDARGGGFFASQRDLTNLRDAHDDKRAAKSANELKLRRQSQNPSSTSVPDKPTVRLVQPSVSTSEPALYTSPDYSADGDTQDSGDDDGQEDPATHSQRAAAEETDAIPRLTQASDSEQGFPDSGRVSHVSEAHTSANEVSGTDQEQDRAPSTTLYSESSQLTLASSDGHRRSTSSGWFSQCSTLQSSSEIALGSKSSRSHRSSQVTTLRGTPTPHEHENQARAHADASARLSLQTLQEASPDLSTTIRAVPQSETSTSSPVEPGPGSETLQDASVAASRPSAPPSESPSDSDSPTSLPRTWRSAYSTGSIHTLPSNPNLQDVTSSPVVRVYDSEPASISEAPQSHSSSPNFVAYSPSVGSVVRHSVSRPRLLHPASSIDSINSRLELYSVQPPGARLASHSSWASFDNGGTPPPLYIPRRRVRHKPASTSLASQAASQASEDRTRTAQCGSNDTMDAEEDIDTLPYPRRPFSNHLSTIASESDGRTGSHHFSYWSAGSGVLTIASGQQTPLSMTFDGSRRRSAPVDSIASSLPSPATHGTGTDVGDMTLGIYREESAVPQPLFRTQNSATVVDNAGPSNAAGTRKYDGPLPPMPPVPQSRDSDEQFDTLSEMTRPSLHQKRSGYSLRGRSNTTPGHSRGQSEVSYVGSDISSQGAGIFPVWARNFYSGNAQLSSKISLSSLSNSDRARTAPQQHRRGDSTWTDHSITSRLGQTYSTEGDVSPTSSHFLPAIFRPRTRPNEASRKSKLQKSHRSQKSNKSNKTNRSRPSNDDRPDSMPILADPAQPEHGADFEVLPSGQPRWGLLQDPDSSPPQRIPRHKPLRKYSKQGQWDQMEFPRPMTKDRLSEFGGSLIGQQPHLAPSKRTSQTRLSFWQAPSFTESLDTLIRSRCNRQVLLFTLGFVMPLFWMLAAVLPLPKQPPSETELEKHRAALPGSEEDIEQAMMRHEAGDAEQRWRDERTYRKAKWWRMLNRIMSVIGLLVIGAVVALVVITVK